MVSVGLSVSIISFVVYFGLLGTVMENAFLCILLSLTALIGLSLTAFGYQKSYKNFKRSVRTLKDRWKMMTSCFMTLMVIFVSYNILFRRPDTMALIYALPYIFAVLLIVWLAGFLTVRRKIKTAAKMDSKCGSHLNNPKDRGDTPAQ